jgi:hypothetical protein
MLKNTRYTHLNVSTRGIQRCQGSTYRCMKLLESRFKFPVSHSGANVINPVFVSNCSISRAIGVPLTSIELGDSQRCNPKSHHRIPPSNQDTDPDGKRTTAQDGQQLKSNDSGICPAPSLVGPSINLPELRKGVCTIVATICSIWSAQEIRYNQARGWHGGGVCEEAIVQIRPFENEMDQGVERVPDKENV